MTSNKELRKERAEQGVCTTCGGILDTDGKTCKACRKDQRDEYRKRREWHISLGICPYCGKERLYGEECMCIECRQKMYEGVCKRLENMSAGERKREKKRVREYNRELYQRRKQGNICVKCGKRKAEKGKVMCSICLGKKRNRARRLYQEMHDILPREDRIAYGLCYICGEPLDGNRDWKVCSRCHERLAENMHKNRRQQSGADHPWRRGNALLFNSQARKYCQTGERKGAVQ